MKRPMQQPAWMERAGCLACHAGVWIMLCCGGAILGFINGQHTWWVHEQADWMREMELRQIDMQTHLTTLDHWQAAAECAVFPEGEVCETQQPGVRP